MAKTKAPVRLSPTKMQAWYESGCPAKFDFSQNWELDEPNRYLEVGSLVHRMMEDQSYVKHVEDKDAVRFYDKLQDLVRMIGLEILFSEVKLEWQMFPGITWVEKVDVIGKLPNGQDVIVDWKTQWGIGWKPLKDFHRMVVPQTLAFQSPGYMVQPPPKVWNKTEWPTAMLYLVAPIRGAGQVFRYDKNDEDDVNFTESVLNMAASLRTGFIPKVKGKLCATCAFSRLCYEDVGWENYYRPR